MTKTVNAMLAYKRAAESGLALETPVVDAFAPGRAPAWAAAWRTDTRRDIKVSDLFYMRDGLANVEDYNPWGTVPEMLWGEPDAAAYAAASPTEAAPGTRWRYLSATANILAAVARGRFAGDAEYWAYPARALFGPIGARTAFMETDTAGNWVGSSYLWASVGDWARLGQLLLDDGRWGERQVLPPGFLALAKTPAMPDGAGHGYGAQSWLLGDPVGGGCRGQGLPEDIVAMSGHWGQVLAVVPSRGVVIVRLGWTFRRSQFDACRFIGEVLQALPR
jgi:CubicO group peptidase (beta-lactamase class C family)